MNVDHMSCGLGVALALLALSASDLHGNGGQVSGVVSGIVGPPPQQPVRDRPPVPQVGKAAVRGRVVDGETGAALARVRVRLTGQGQTRPAVLTDGQGVFTFSGLPAGGYGVLAEKATYLAGSYPDRTTSLRSSANRLILRGDEVVDVLLSLHHGSAITGRVVDELGDPIEFAQVAVLPVSRYGTPRMGQRGNMPTNDIGEFRIGRLVPGRYIVMATAGRFQDSGMSEASPLPQPVPTYYPNVLSKSEAQVITVRRAETVSGIEVAMVDGVPTVVTGRVVAADGQPASQRAANGFVNARLDDRDLPGGSNSGAQIKPDGSFRLLLTPGNYILEANRTLVGVDPGPSGQQFGTTRLSVAGASMDVTIVLGGGATASGRVVFEGTTPPPSPPAQAGAPLNSPDGSPCRSGQLQIAPDWSFKIDGLLGTCAAPPFGMFGRWTLKSVRFNNQELRGGSVSFESGQHYGNVQIVVTDRRTELNLHVTDQQGQQTRDYVALVFSTDKSRWTGPFALVRTFAPPPLEMVAALQQASASVTANGVNPAMPAGREVVAALTAGDYYAIAIDDIDAEGSRDPDVLERLAPSATRVTVGDDAAEVTLLRQRLADIIR